MRDYGRFNKYDLEIKKDVYVDLDYKTDADWDFDIDINKYVDKDIDIDVNVESKVDLKGNVVEIDFLVEDVSKAGGLDPAVDNVESAVDDQPSDTGNLEWDIVGLTADGMSMASFATYERGYALNPDYATSGVMAQAVGPATFVELAITYEAYDTGFVASGELFVASDGHHYA